MNYTISNSFDNSPYNSFVNPHLCDVLRIAGITKNTVYLWKVLNNVAELFTFYFDTDDYYGSASAEIIKLTNPIIIPAYTLKDLEVVMPGGYSLMKDAFDTYELSLEKLWDCVPVTGKRLPDVFAEMLLQLISKRIIQPNSVNMRLMELLK